MDFRNPTSYETLIINLRALKSKNSFKKEYKVIDYSVTLIKKIAFLRFKLNYLSGFEKEIDQLNNTENEYLKILFRIIRHSETMEHYQQLNCLTSFFSGISSFLALTIIGLTISVILFSITLNPIVALLLILVIAASLTIFQINCSNLGKSPYLANLEYKMSDLLQTLKKITLSLDRIMRSIESLITYQETNNSLLQSPPSAPPSDFRNSLSCPSMLNTPSSKINFFRMNEFTAHNISAKVSKNDTSPLFSLNIATS